MRVVWAVFGAIFLASWWEPAYPAEQALHHSLTLVAVGLLLLARRRFALADSSVVMVLVFLVLHTIAARWIYSFVPYDDWTRALFGFELTEVMGWRRNHFDRLVHFSYGLLLAPVIAAAVRSRWAGAIAVEAVISTSALYELFEWGAAMTLSAGAAEAYNGQQGDVWDAHRDIALALIGAVVGVLVRAATRSARAHRDVGLGVPPAAGSRA